MSYRVRGHPSLRRTFAQTEPGPRRKTARAPPGRTRSKFAVWPSSGPFSFVSRDGPDERARLWKNSASRVGPGCGPQDHEAPKIVAGIPVLRYGDPRSESTRLLVG